MRARKNPESWLVSHLLVVQGFPHINPRIGWLEIRQILMTWRMVKEKQTDLCSMCCPWINGYAGKGLCYMIPWISDDQCLQTHLNQCPEGLRASPRLCAEEVTQAGMVVHPTVHPNWRIKKTDQVIHYQWGPGHPENQAMKTWTIPEFWLGHGFSRCHPSAASDACLPPEVWVKWSSVVTLLRSGPRRSRRM